MVKNPILSILIPSRNEMFLKRTIEDILENSEADTEILVGLDGEWADPPLEDSERVTILSYPESIGQRAITNKLAKLSQAKYVMKVDAHCAFDKGFDRKLIEVTKDDWTIVPVMKNLHAFDWVCEKCGWRKYQGPTPDKCGKCDGKVKREMVWQAKSSPNSTSYRVDTNLKFQYWGQYKKKQEGDLVETMSLQGSCFMTTRERYWRLNLCDEEFGSWGQQGAEVAIKSWLSGGKVICNRKTWYAHMFRTQGGDFGFPYTLSGKQIGHARKYCRDIFLNNKWEGQVHPFSWLLEKFWPIPEWTEEDLKKQKERDGKTWGKSTKRVVFYTDNRLPIKIANKVQNQLKKAKIPIICCSLKKMDFGDKNIHFPSLKRSYLTMFKQMLAGLENSSEDIIFFCEHDVLYHPSHFDFTPPEKDKIYYNTNVWRIRATDGLAVRTDDCRQVSGICADRELLLDHYKKRIAILEKKAKELDEKEFNRFIRRMGFEPGTHGRIKEFSDLKSEKWESKYPNLDIRHGKVLTKSKWKPEDYRNKRFAKGWKEAKEIEGWGKTEDIIKDFN